MLRQMSRITFIQTGRLGTILVFSAAYFKGIASEQLHTQKPDAAFTERKLELEF